MTGVKSFITLDAGHQCRCHSHAPAAGADLINICAAVIYSVEKHCMGSAKVSIVVANERGVVVIVAGAAVVPLVDAWVALRLVAVEVFWLVLVATAAAAELAFLVAVVVAAATVAAAVTNTFAAVVASVVAATVHSAVATLAAAIVAA